MPRPFTALFTPCRAAAPAIFRGCVAGRLSWPAWVPAMGMAGHSKWHNIRLSC